ncbi:MAG: PP2C family protein-serine/threonine phosphatase, partial [Planctomycetota bacterium]|nr:PP2C family protein-serine/threonine phosphatase [Planctomycetota bacterium]
LCECTTSNTFVTLFVGVYDHDTKTLQYVDAGHGHWIIRRAGQAPVQGEKPEKPPIGIVPDMSYTSRSLDLGIGDRIVLFSDGMIELFGPDGEQYSIDRLIKSIVESNSPQEDVNFALDALQNFISKGAKDDDTTIASLEIVN